MTMTAEQLAQTISPDLEMLCSSEELTSERREALARIVEHLTPPNLLTLLDELERKDKRIAELEWDSEQAECVNLCLNELGVPQAKDDGRLSLWGRVVAYGEVSAAERDELRALRAAMPQCAELQARTVTVTLPTTFWYEHDDLTRELAVLSKRQVKKALKEAFDAAGINLTVEG
ncbi:hypothetical protein [Atlantibacter sp.]|uniref:hypothetical protein n=1 Tax=Atlantibacter sp. TaxID=1903473 RepID=UPI00289A347B|nr:hypothetical protein [Atlantibacter sp.]